MSITKSFVLAGKATFTIETPDKGHRTYRVDRKAASLQFPEAFFVKLLTGPENTRDYTYMGKLDPYTGQLELTPKSKLPEDSLPVRLLNRVLARVWTSDHATYEKHGYKTHHEGSCGRCGRA